MLPRANATLPLLFGLALTLHTTELHAHNPWSSELSPEREQALLTEARSNAELSEDERPLFDFAIASGMLLATAVCESSGTVRSHSYVDKQWVGDVRNSASVTISNLSDQTIWLVEVSIAPERPSIPRPNISPSGDPPGSWSTNLPFLPPHSQALIMMPCNTLTASGGESFDTLDSDGVPGPMTKSLARKLALTPTRFNHRNPRLRTTYHVDPRQPSLAQYALPHVDDREAARLLLRAIRKYADEFEAVVERPQWRPEHSVAEALAAAPLAGAHGIVDVIENDPPDELAKLLGEALGQRSGANDEALLRLVTNVCQRGEPEAIEHIVATEFRSKHADDWVLSVLAACPLAPERTVAIIEQLAKDPGIRGGGPPTGLIRFIKLAPSPNFEIGLSVMLGADRASFAELVLEPGAVPEIIDGGERAEVIWYSMATLPSSERLARLESLVRPVDLAEILTMLIPWKMESDRLALLDRLAARLPELPAGQRGAALEPVFRAAIDSPYLERSLLGRLFTWAEHDPQRLGPLAIEALSKNQSMFTNEALAALPYEPIELLDKLDGPLQNCHARGRLNDCFALYEADPALWSAVESGLTPEFRASLIEGLTQADPSDDQREILPKYLRLGIDIDPIATVTCERGKELARFGTDASEHAAFLDEFAPEHPCTKELLEQLGYGMRIMKMVIGGAIGVLGLVGLLFLRSRRRQRALFDEI
ncbi:MAG: hypothetical protein R6X02_24640 [Enhygromyxa sp.]